MNIARIFLNVRTIVVLSMLLWACAPIQAGPDTPLTIEGFKPYPSARSFDGPGRIYRVDPQGNVFGVTIVKIAAAKGNEVIPKISRTVETTLQTVIETVGPGASAIPIALKGSFDNKLHLWTESVRGLREYIDDSDIDKMLPLAMEEVRIRHDNKYYVIRETILTDNLNYIVTRSALNSLGIEAHFIDFLRTQVGVKINVTNSDISINAKFNKPLRVWYKPERLEVSRTMGMGPGQPPRVTIDRGGASGAAFSLPATVTIEP
jgi:hypothetical protein